MKITKTKAPWTTRKQRWTNPLLICVWLILSPVLLPVLIAVLSDAFLVILGDEMPHRYPAYYWLIWAFLIFFSILTVMILNSKHGIDEFKAISDKLSLKSGTEH